MQKSAVLLVALLILAGSWGVVRPLAAWQSPDSRPPAIVAFTSDLSSLTVAETEAGETTVVLSWQALNLADPYQLHLDAYQLDEWVSLLREHETLPPAGTRTLFVTHPLNFGPPTYRLSVVDADGRVVDERYVIIPYDVESVTEPPAIESFATSAENLDANDLALGQARAPLSWEISNRVPSANLVFEQVLDDGSAIDVELPRPNLWVASKGEGAVAPLLPRDSREVHLRLRVVDVIADRVYDQAELTLPVVGMVSPTVTPRPPATAQPGPQIIAFSASPNPAYRGDSVTVAWSVRGQGRITLYQRTSDQRLPAAIATGLTSQTGSVAVPLTGEAFNAASSVGFTLQLQDSAGRNIADRTVVVDIVDRGSGQVVLFTASRTSVERGGAVSLTWQASGTDGTVLEIIDTSGNSVERVDRGLSAAGTADIALPDSITGTARIVLWPVSQPQADLTNPFSYRQGTSASIDIQITCQYVFFTTFGTQPGCPAGEALSVQAAFEPFENGYMVWRGDTGAIYALFNNGALGVYPQSQYEGLPDASVSDQPPAGRLQPVSGFGRVWANIPGVRESLGWATSPEQGYSMMIQGIAVSPDPSHAFTTYFNLPNNSLVGLIGTDRWGFID